MEVAVCALSEAATQMCSKIAFRNGCSPVNLQHIFKTPFPRNTYEWLLLSFRMAVLKTIAKITGKQLPRSRSCKSTGLFSKLPYTEWIQKYTDLYKRSTQDIVKHLTWSFFKEINNGYKPLTIFANTPS